MAPGSEEQGTPLRGWVQAFLFPLKLCSWRCPGGTGARGMHLPRRDVDAAKATAEGKRSPSLEPWLGKAPGCCWQGSVLGRRQETTPTDYFLLVGCFPVHLCGPNWGITSSAPYKGDTLGALCCLGTARGLAPQLAASVPGPASHGRLPRPPILTLPLLVCTPLRGENQDLLACYFSDLPSSR